MGFSDCTFGVISCGAPSLDCDKISKQAYVEIVKHVFSLNYRNFEAEMESVYDKSINV